MSEIIQLNMSAVRELKSRKLVQTFTMKDVEPLVLRLKGESRANWKDRCRDKLSELYVEQTVQGIGAISTAQNRGKVITKITVDPETEREIYQVDPIKKYESSLETKERKLLAELAKIREQKQNQGAINVG